MAPHIAVVTGASGFVGLELTHQLLAKGYKVRATVRSSAAAAKVAPLQALGAALPGHLELVEADLLTPGSFDAAVRGADYVFHCASPFFIEAEDPQRELVAPAVEGTRNLLLSVARHKGSVRRVVLTSSCAAVKGRQPSPPKNGSRYTEEDWNETSTVEGGEAYWVSKTAAERAAWELAKEHGIDLVTILPEFIMGPPLSQRADSTSVAFFKAWVEGAAPGGGIFADVRDVARAHVLAAENPAASGRYIVAAPGSASPADISSWLRQRFPEFEFAEGSEEEASRPGVDPGRVQRELGLALTPVKETLCDMTQALIALGIAAPKHKQRMRLPEYLTAACGAARYSACLP